MRRLSIFVYSPKTGVSVRISENSSENFFHEHTVQKTPEINLEIKIFQHIWCWKITYNAKQDFDLFNFLDPRKVSSGNTNNIQTVFFVGWVKYQHHKSHVQYHATIYCVN